MLEIRFSGRYHKDLKRVWRRRLPIAELDEVVRMLSEERELPAKYRDHALQGGWAGHRECHIRPDWLLVYRIDNDVLTLVLVRTGSHADLF